MATLADGVRVFSAADAADILAADQNSLQDILIGHLGALEVAAPMSCLRQDLSVADTWHYRKALGWWAWQTTAAFGAGVLPLGTLRTGQVITAIDATVRGTTAGGSIILYRQNITVPAAFIATATWAANPWATGGADAVKSANAGLPHTILAAHEYYLELNPSANDPQYLQGVSYTVQFGT